MPMVRCAARAGGRRRVHAVVRYAAITWPPDRGQAPGWSWLCRGLDPARRAPRGELPEERHHPSSKRVIARGVAREEPGPRRSAAVAQRLDLDVRSLRSQSREDLPMRTCSPGRAQGTGSPRTRGVEAARPGELGARGSEGLEPSSTRRSASAARGSAGSASASARGTRKLNRPVRSRVSGAADRVDTTTNDSGLESGAESRGVRIGPPASRPPPPVDAEYSRGATHGTAP